VPLTGRASDKSFYATARSTGWRARSAVISKCRRRQARADAAQPKRRACSCLMRSQARSCFESRPVSPVFAGSSAPQNREFRTLSVSKPRIHLGGGGQRTRAKGLVAVIG
jgi:hypothetical protein